MKKLNPLHGKSTQELSQIISPRTTDFVLSLNGRYSKHVSDTFLTIILALRMKEGIQTWPDMLPSGVAYDVSVVIFETILENICMAGGNGHHVAQDYAKCFVEYDKDEPKPAA